MPSPRFRVKVCGVRRFDDIRAAGGAGSDAVCLNFCAPRVRAVDRGVAATLAAEASRLGICPAGLFVNEPADSVAEITGDVGLRTIQQPPVWGQCFSGRLPYGVRAFPASRMGSVLFRVQRPGDIGTREKAGEIGKELVCPVDSGSVLLAHGETSSENALTPLMNP